MTDTQTVLIATDLSDASNPAIELGGRLARQLDAAILLVSSFDPTPVFPMVDFATGPNLWADAMAQQEEAIHGLLEKRRTQMLPEMRCEVHVLRHASAATAILDFARDRAVELIVVGSHGRSALQRFWLGSVAEKVVRRAHCSVLVARAPTP